MVQSVSVITLGTEDLARSKHFYVDGFGWQPAFENDEIIFYQLNGTILGTFRKDALEGDMQRTNLNPNGAFALAQNLESQAAVTLLIERLVAAGGTLLRAADSPAHGGFRGYVADPDSHAWEIAWNPGLPLDEAGNVTFGV
jgi:catechol 2,3-dioxygenase-like lactoylglutathione lyase family enzyme